MPFEIEKQERETSQNMVKRFLRRIKRTGILYRARMVRFKERPKSRQLKKRAALRREEIRKERERMAKMGIKK